MKIGEKIKQKRKEHKMSQRELAAKLEIPYSTLANYENNHREPKLEQLTKIAAALECSPVDLLDDNADMFQKWDTEHPGMGGEVAFWEKVYSQFGHPAVDLMNTFNELNDLGKEKARDYINDLAEQDKYKEGD